MKKFLFLTIISMIFVITACEPPKGEPVEYAKMCDKDNDGKTIETSGFLDDGGGIFCSNTSGRMECGFKLKNSPDDEKGFSTDIAVGSGANAMDKIESGYQKSDIAIRDNEGNKIDLSKKVTVTGDLRSTNDPVSKDVVCYLKVLKIEQ